MSLSRLFERRRSPLEIRKLYTRYARLYDFDDAVTLFTKKPIRKVILSKAEISGNEKILEVASGTGEMSLLISNNLNRGRLVCLDVSIGTLSIGREKLRRKNLDKDVDFVVGAGEKLPFPDNRLNVREEESLLGYYRVLTARKAT